MKQYRERRLPLNPEGKFERLALFTFERSARGVPEIWLLLAALQLFLCAVTLYWVAGILGLMFSMTAYQGFEARAITRMMERHTEPPNTALEATADKASDLPKSGGSAESQSGGASAFGR